MIIRDPHTNPSQANPDVTLAGVNYATNPDAGYGDHITNTGAICNTSASHTYGNVLAIIEKWLTSIFPKDLFKTVMAATALASRQLTHLPSQFRKKEFPVMTLMPRIVFGQDENRFLANTLINSRFTDTHALWGDGSLIPLAEDKRKRLYVHGHYNRAVMYVDVIMSFNTRTEQTNYMSYLHNIVGVGHTKSIRSPLELYIPDDFCELIGNVAEINVKSKDGSVYDFLTYMNSIWYNPITYKLKGGSNTDEFFMYYITDIDVVVQEPQAGQGIKEGQIRRAFDISFTIRCDFNTIGYFTLNAPRIKKQININPKSEDSSIVPIFSDVINLNDFILPIGWSILSWPIFKLKYGENSVSIDNILNESLRVVIDYHLKMGIPMENFIKIQFRENGQILTNELYYIDWARRLLVLSNPNPRRTYRLIISVSYDYINNLIKELYNLE